MFFFAWSILGLLIFTTGRWECLSLLDPFKKNFFFFLTEFCQVWVGFLSGMGGGGGFVRCGWGFCPRWVGFMLSGVFVMDPLWRKGIIA